MKTPPTPTAIDDLIADLETAALDARLAKHVMDHSGASLDARTLHAVSINRIVTAVEAAAAALQARATQVGDDQSDPPPIGDAEADEDPTARETHA